MKTLNTRGDTLVEVLVALAVASFLVVIAYTSSNRGLTGAQVAQDREQGLKMAESQIEGLRLLPNAAAQPATFCLDLSSGTPVAFYPTGAIATDVDLETPATYANYGPSCTTGIYHISITHPSPPSVHVFTIRVRWQHAGDVGNDEVELQYTAF
jgi:prepilin-type N-terminal cleavage/methylation domain-containing protein